MTEMDRLISLDKSISGHPPQERGTFERIFRPMAAKFVGVALFVFVGCCALNSGDLVGAALGHGLTIALLIVGFGAISGGHFNPAVTVGVIMGGGLPVYLLPSNIIAQLGGGMLGASIVRATLPSEVYAKIGGGTHQLGKDVNAGWGFLIEVVLTTVLVLTVLMAAVNNQTKSKLAPLAIGFAVSVDIMAGGPLTGASMNPARAFGPAVVASSVVDNAWRYHYIYWLGPLCGALLAALLFRFIFLSPNIRWISRRETSLQAEGNN